MDSWCIFQAKNAVGFHHWLRFFTHHQRSPHLGFLERRILSPRSTSVSIPMSRVNWWSKKPPISSWFVIWNQQKLICHMCFVGLWFFFVHFRVFKWIVKENNHCFQYEALARSWTQDFSDHQDDVTISRLKRKQLNYCTSSSKRWNYATIVSWIIHTLFQSDPWDYSICLGLPYNNQPNVGKHTVHDS